MVDFVTLTCPSCGGALQITNDIERFGCAHCGNEHIVNRRGGVVTISPILHGMAQIQKGTDKTAAELAVKRLPGEISEHREILESSLARISSNVPLAASVLNKMGKISSLESVFVSNRKVRELLKMMTMDDLEAAIVELRDDEEMVRSFIEHKVIREKLISKEKQLDENRRILDS